MKILFVCTGNTCRSPMAEGLMSDILDRKEIRNIGVDSAGIYAIDGQSASRWAIEVLKEEGIDISSHKAKMVNRSLLEEADLILTMSTSHKKALNSKYDFVKEKTYTLKEYAYGVEEDILDPFGGSKRIYENTKEEIKKALESIAKKEEKQK